jgi:hypothetical protein
MNDYQQALAAARRITAGSFGSAQTTLGECVTDAVIVAIQFLRNHATLQPHPRMGSTQQPSAPASFRASTSACLWTAARR